MATADTLELFTVILAAGTASRFGRTKQVAEIQGQPMVRRAVQLAESVSGHRSVLVLGHDARKVFAAAQPLPGFVVVNDNYQEGIGSSLSRGAHALPDSADGVMVLLCDQPFVRASDLQQLATAWRQSPGQIAACRYGSSMGVPAIFPRRLFARLTGLTGDSGARSLIGEELPAVTLVDCPDAARDIDEPSDIPVI